MLFKVIRDFVPRSFGMDMDVVSQRQLWVTVYWTHCNVVTIWIFVIDKHDIGATVLTKYSLTIFRWSIGFNAVFSRTEFKAGSFYLYKASKCCTVRASALRAMTMWKIFNFLLNFKWDFFALTAPFKFSHFLGGEDCPDRWAYLQSQCQGGIFRLEWLHSPSARRHALTLFWGL